MISICTDELETNCEACCFKRLVQNVVEILNNVANMQVQLD